MSEAVRELLIDLLGDLMLLHQIAKHPRLRRRIEEWTDRILKILDEYEGPAS